MSDLPPSLNPGDLIFTSFRLFGRHAGWLLPTTAVALAPFLAVSVQYALGAATAPTDEIDQLAEWVARPDIAILNWLCAYLAVVPVVHGLRRAGDALDVTPFNALLGLWRTWRAALGSAALISVAATVAFWGIAALTSPHVAFAALAIPYVVASCALFVALPAIAHEQEGAISAIRWSWRVTRGHRLSIFAASAALELIVGAVALPLAQSLDLGPGANWVLSASLNIVAVALTAVLAALVFERIVAREQAPSADPGA